MFSITKCYLKLQNIHDHDFVSFECCAHDCFCQIEWQINCFATSARLNATSWKFFWLNEIILLIIAIKHFLFNVFALDLNMKNFHYDKNRKISMLFNLLTFFYCFLHLIFFLIFNNKNTYKKIVKKIRLLRCALTKKY